MHFSDRYSWLCAAVFTEMVQTMMILKSITSYWQLYGSPLQSMDGYLITLNPWILVLQFHCKNKVCLTHQKCRNMHMYTMWRVCLLWCDTLNFYSVDQNKMMYISYSTTLSSLYSYPKLQLTVNPTTVYSSMSIDLHPYYCSSGKPIGIFDQVTPYADE